MRRSRLLVLVLVLAIASAVSVTPAESYICPGTQCMDDLDCGWYCDYCNLCYCELTACGTSVCRGYQCPPYPGGGIN